VKLLSCAREIRNRVICVSVFALLLTFSRAQENTRTVPNLAGFPDADGAIRTFNAK
jgi:hypothetical protein